MWLSFAHTYTQRRNELIIRYPAAINGSTFWRRISNSIPNHRKNMQFQQFFLLSNSIMCRTINTFYISSCKRKMEDSKLFADKNKSILILHAVMNQHTDRICHNLVGRRGEEKLVFDVAPCCRILNIHISSVVVVVVAVVVAVVVIVVVAWFDRVGFLSR